MLFLILLSKNVTSISIWPPLMCIQNSWSQNTDSSQCVRVCVSVCDKASCRNKCSNTKWENELAHVQPSRNKTPFLFFSFSSCNRIPFYLYIATTKSIIHAAYIQKWNWIQHTEYVPTSAGNTYLYCGIRSEFMHHAFVQFLNAIVSKHTYGEVKINPNEWALHLHMHFNCTVEDQSYYI